MASPCFPKSSQVTSTSSTTSGEAQRVQGISAELEEAERG